MYKIRKSKKLSQVSRASKKTWPSCLLTADLIKPNQNRTVRDVLCVGQSEIRNSRFWLFYKCSDKVGVLKGSLSIVVPLRSSNPDPV